MVVNFMRETLHAVIAPAPACGSPECNCERCHVRGSAVDLITIYLLREIVEGALVECPEAHMRNERVPVVGDIREQIAAQLRGASDGPAAPIQVP